VELPAFSDGLLPTPMPESCLTKTTWDDALLNGYGELPKTLGGMLILADTPAPDYTYHVLSADLGGDEIEITNLGLGNDGSLSPDGQTVVYATQEGLQLLTLATGDITAISDTTLRDREPVWSPDGSKIAFTRGPASGLIGDQGPYGLMLVDEDGSNQVELLSDGEANHVQTWMPYSKSLLYTVMNPDGATLKYINSETKEVTTLTNLNFQGAEVSVSPNGRQIAYEALLPSQYFVVYISSLDGSNAKLIANTAPYVVTNMHWSPDGEWLAVSVQDISQDEYSSTIALVNPDTCQVIPMTNLKGYVTSWR
jgi:Tol biopolymer transport system component